MKRLGLTVMVMICSAMLAAGCARATCKTIEDACGGGDDAIEDCVEEYNDGDGDCKKSIREYADCVDDKGCESESCFDELMDVAEDC